MGPRGSRVEGRRLVLEAAVIVASILAAFALERWWDARLERAEEQLTLGALQVEFLEAKAELERHLNFHQSFPPLSPPQIERDNILDTIDMMMTLQLNETRFD